MAGARRLSAAPSPGEAPADAPERAGATTMTWRDVASIITDWSRDRRTSRREWALFLLGVVLAGALVPRVVQVVLGLWNVNQQWRFDAAVAVVLWVVFAKELTARYRARGITARWAIGQAVTQALAVVGAWVGTLRSLQENPLFGTSATPRDAGLGWTMLALASFVVWVVDGLVILYVSFRSETAKRIPRATPSADASGRPAGPPLLGS